MRLWLLKTPHALDPLRLPTSSASQANDGVAEAALCRECPVVHSRTERPMCRGGPVCCRGGLCTAAAAPFHQSTLVNTLTIACASSTVRSSLPPFTTTNTRLSGAGLLGVLTTIVPVQSAATV